MKQILIISLALLAGIAINLSPLFLKASVVYHSLFIVVCILFVLASFIFSLLAYRLGGKLSTVFSLIAAGQLINFPLAAYFFNERISSLHWLGLIILLVGMVLLVVESS